MEDSRPTVWLEDLEGHREPSLYYLSSEEEPSGPHLICDWNGTPTNYDELDIDLISKMIEYSPTETLNPPFPSDEYNPSHLEQEVEEVEDIHDVTIQMSHEMNCTTADSHSSETNLSDDDDSRLQFLTVPPLVMSLLKRQMKLQAQLISQSKETQTSKLDRENDKSAGCDLIKNTSIPNGTHESCDGIQTARVKVQGRPRKYAKKQIVTKD